MNIEEKKEWLEKKVNEKGYNHSNLRYSILNPIQLGTSPYEVRIDLLDSSTFQVCNIDERGCPVDFPGSTKVFTNFEEASSNFINRLEKRVHFNQRAIEKNTISIPEYSSTLWDK